MDAEEMSRLRDLIRDKTPSSVATSPQPETVPQERPDRSEREPEPQQPEPLPPSLFERWAAGEDIEKAAGEIKQFGYDLFLQAPEDLAPVTTVAVGPDYVVGPGDEVLVRIWGKAELSASGTVDRGGKLALPKVGVFPVAGKSFADLQKDLKARYDRIFGDYQIDVSLGVLRTVSVLVVGKVRRPGRYELSSLSTVINALMAAGGPLKNGSMRNVRLVRDNETAATLDLYELLFRGRKSGDVRLRPEDTVFVSGVGPLVAVTGSVTTPGVYELRPGEMSLKKADGGPEPRADRASRGRGSQGSRSRPGATHG